MNKLETIDINLSQEMRKCFWSSEELCFKKCCKKYKKGKRCKKCPKS